MSDKNGPSGLQWNKTTTTNISSSTITTKAAENKNVANNNVMVHSPVTPSSSHLYDNRALYGGNPGHTNDNIYSAVRYQAPAGQQRHAAAAATNLNVSSASSSGFVPPFPSSATNATPPGLAPNSYATDYYPRDTFPHLNVQQQLELNKIMSAMAGNSQQQLAPQSVANTTSVNSLAVAGSSPLPGAGATSDSSGNDGGIPNNLADSVLNVIGGEGSSCPQSTAVPVIHGRLLGVGVGKDPDAAKMQGIVDMVEERLCDNSKQEVRDLLERIGSLKPLEKLMLYLRLPGDAPETDPLRLPQNPLGTRTEINHTINWVRTHLEHDPQVSIPKQDVYDDYMIYCERLQIKPLSTADFGKVMKQVFPGIRPRRLGTRGHSRYCYAAMRKTTSLEAPKLPELGIGEQSVQTIQLKSEVKIEDEQKEEQAVKEEDGGTWSIIKTWAEQVLHVKVHNAQDLASCIFKTQNNQTSAPLGAVASNKLVLAQRDILKEKRLLTDIGPLKKRRKKKRKGSSSSEGSPTICNNSSNLVNKLSSPQKAITPIITEDEQKPTTSMQQYMLLNMKKETDLVETTEQLTTPVAPQQQQQQYQQTMPINLATEQRTVLMKVTSDNNASAVGIHENYGNVGETNILQRQPTLTNAAAVRNLTPKILQMSMPIPTPTPTSPNQTPTIVKEEIMDEYSSPQPTIYCKKVLKAHQTKGFWMNTPNVHQNQPQQQQHTTTNATNASISATRTTANASSLIVPSIITTAASPPLPPTNSMGVIMGVGSAAGGVTNSDQQPQQYLMGPPAHMANSISTSPLAVLSDSITNFGNVNNVGPKVASRNMLLLRAKRQIAMAAAAAAATTTTTTTTSNNSDVVILADEKDGADLPENLGLPRERVISICNMDKHELDDYFLPVQEEEDDDDDQDQMVDGNVVQRGKKDRKCVENIQGDQESELLQYFQMGDAEEKLNKNINYSLDAANNNNNNNNNYNNNKKYPTANHVINNNKNNNNIMNIGFIPNINETTPTATTNVINKMVENELQQQQTNVSGEMKIERKTPINAVKNNSTPIPTLISSETKTNNHLLNNFVNGVTNDDINCNFINNHNKLADDNNNKNNNNKNNDDDDNVVSKLNVQTTIITPNTLASTFNAAVGSASASLALLSQKHHLQQQQLQDKVQQQVQVQQRQINLRGNNNNNNTSNNNNAYLANDERLISARKNRIFVPISPNINSITTNDNNNKYQSSPIPQQQLQQQKQLQIPALNDGNNCYFASPTTTSSTTSTPTICSSTSFRNLKMNATSFSIVKQQSLDMMDNDDCRSSDPMIGANRRKRSYMTTSASAPPSPSILQQRLKPFKNINNNNNQQFIARNVGEFGQLQKQQSPPSWSLINNTGSDAQNNFQNDASIDQNSLDFDFFNSQLEVNPSTTATTSVSTTAMLEVEALGVSALLTNSETQRSQSVPLSQLQRMHSPFINNNSKINTINHIPVEHDFMVLQNECDSSVDRTMNEINGTSTSKELDVAAVVASDTAGLLDDVDYSVMLSSPDFMAKFESLTQTNATASTTCSSSGGSSSGYSSSGGTYCNISRSVPSTPLPHHKHVFGFYEQRRRSGVMDDCLQSSPIMGSVATVGSSAAVKCSSGGNGFNHTTTYVGSCGSGNVRCCYDISKSMPTTPITTPCFRYSPSEFSRDFLINGNTLDSLQSYGATTGDPTTTDAADVMHDNHNHKLVSVGLNVDSLIDGDVKSVSLENFDTGNSSDTEAIMVGADLLDDF